MLPPVFDRPQERIIDVVEERKPDMYDMDRGLDIACREITDALHLKLDDADKFEFKKALSNFITMVIKKEEMKEKMGEEINEDY